MLNPKKSLAMVVLLLAGLIPSVRAETPVEQYRNRGRQVLAYGNAVLNKVNSTYGQVKGRDANLTNDISTAIDSIKKLNDQFEVQAGNGFVSVAGYTVHLSGLESKLRKLEERADKGLGWWADSHRDAMGWIRSFDTQVRPNYEEVPGMLTRLAQASSTPRDVAFKALSLASEIRSKYGYLASAIELLRQDDNNVATANASEFSRHLENVKQLSGEFWEQLHAGRDLLNSNRSGSTTTARNSRNGGSGNRNGGDNSRTSNRNGSGNGNGNGNGENNGNGDRNRTGSTNGRSNTVDIAGVESEGEVDAQSPRNSSSTGENTTRPDPGNGTRQNGENTARNPESGGTDQPGKNGTSTASTAKTFSHTVKGGESVGQIIVDEVIPQLKKAGVPVPPLWGPGGLAETVIAMNNLDKAGHIYADKPLVLPKPEYFQKEEKKQEEKPKNNNPVVQSPTLLRAALPGDQDSSTGSLLTRTVRNTGTAPVTTQREGDRSQVALAWT